MKIEIVTPSKILYNNEIEYFVAKGSNGEFAILKDHIPMVSTIKEGFIKIVKTDKSERFFYVDSAIVEFKKNKANILAQIAIEGSTIEEAKKIYTEYKQTIEKKHKKDKMDYTKIEKELHKNIKKAKASKI